MLFPKKSFISGSDERWDAMFVLDLYEDYLGSTERESMEVTFDFLNTQIWEYMKSCDFGNNVLRVFYLNNIEQLLKEAKQFEGKQLGDVMESLFGAQYLYFDGLETYFFLDKVLEETGLCLYSCNHMG